MFGAIRNYLWAVVGVIALTGSFHGGQLIERERWVSKALKAAEAIKAIESERDTRNHELGQRSAAKQAAEVRYVDRIIREVVAMPVDPDCSRLPNRFVELFNRAASGDSALPVSSPSTSADAGAHRE